MIKWWRKFYLVRDPFAKN